jgi:hypothetical protein
MNFEFNLFLCYLAGLGFLGVLFAAEALWSWYEKTRSRVRGSGLS